jgi:hypothetical protein
LVSIPPHAHFPSPLEGEGGAKRRMGGPATPGVASSEQSNELHPNPPPSSQPQEGANSTITFRAPRVPTSLTHNPARPAHPCCRVIACEAEGPLTRPSADLSPQREVMRWRHRAPAYLSLWGRGRRAAPGEGAFLCSVSANCNSPELTGTGQTPGLLGSIVPSPLRGEGGAKRRMRGPHRGAMRDPSDREERLELTLPVSALQ